MQQHHACETFFSTSHSCTVNPFSCAAAAATFAVTFLCYAGVTFCGYAAFGNAVRDNILDSLSVGPLWLKDLAHMMVVVHVIAGYQVYA